MLRGFMRPYARLLVLLLAGTSLSCGESKTQKVEHALLNSSSAFRDFDCKQAQGPFFTCKGFADSPRVTAVVFVTISRDERCFVAKRARAPRINGAFKKKDRQACLRTSGHGT